MFVLGLGILFGFLLLLGLFGRIRHGILSSIFGESGAIGFDKVTNFLGLLLAKSPLAIVFLFALAPLFIAWSATEKRFHAYRALAMILAGCITLVLMALLWRLFDSLGWL